MAKRISVLWTLTIAIVIATCLAFAIVFTPRGPSEEEKFAHAAMRLKTYNMISSGIDAHVAGNRVEAERIYREAITSDPTIGSAHYLLGSLLLEQSKLDAAIDEFNRAIELEEFTEHIYNSRGVAYYRHGQSDAALRDFETAIAKDPKFRVPRRNRALMLFQKGDHAGAMDALTSLIDEAETPAGAQRAYVARGVIRALNGDLEDAEADFTTVLEYGWGKARILNALHNRARVREARGDAAGALQDRNQYARLEALPETAERFVRPLKSAENQSGREG